MDEVTHQMFLNLEDVMGTKWDYVQVQFMCFIILFAVVAAVCAITAIVIVLRKKQSEAIEVERENNAKLETINKTIPIIAMTANAFSEDIQHSLAAGMNAHVSKPVEMKVLEKTIRSIKSGGGGHRTAGHGTVTNGK
ncbi:hypothetical protein [Ruminococcus sp. AF31-8BH]|uniref:hypothetical protein n=1 Tax=Ruminococcus sp. AF31-8BH TaxID=2293174 RepID=UPI0026A85950